MASFLESLLSVPTVSGGEKALTDKIDRYIKKYTDETHTDALGNLIATRHALSKKGKKPLKLAFFCAVDAPGRIVTYIEENGLAERGSFIVNPEGKIVVYEVNAGNVGRNADELLRRLQASQFVAEHGDQVCPAKWQPGAETLKPSLDLVGML